MQSNNYSPSHFSSSDSDDSNFDQSSELDNSEHFLFNSLLLSDIERFTAHVGRLRKSLFSCQKELNDFEKTEIKITNNNNLQIHSSLALVSKSIKDLINKHSFLFKTFNILTSTEQLINSIKEANFNLNGNSTNNKNYLNILQALDKLENAVANSLRGALNNGNNYLVKNEKLSNDENKITKNLNFDAETEQNEEEEEEKEEEDYDDDRGSVRSAKANSSSGVSSSPIVLLPIKKTTKIVRRHSAFQLSSQIPPHPPPNKIKNKTNIGGLVHSLQQQQPLLLLSDGQSNNINKQQRSMLANQKYKYLQQIGKQKQFSNNSNSQSVEIISNNNKCNNNNNNKLTMWQLLEQCNDGMEIAFERCKNWSKYASQLLSFGRARLALEQEYSQRLLKIAEQQLNPLLTIQQLENNLTFLDNNKKQQKMPLSKLFNQLLENNKQFSIRAESTIQHLQQRFIESLESRQKEHNIKRRKLKINYTKQRKQMESCAEELRRARQTHTNKGEQYLRVREVTIRQECNNNNNQINNNNNEQIKQQKQFLIRNSSEGNNNQQILLFNQKRKNKEIEKRKKAEEEALNKKSDAEQEVIKLEKELDEYKIKLKELRCQTIHELSDLIRQCELTTIACTATFLKGIANLWAPVPKELESLADVARTSQPGQEFMSFLQQQQSFSLINSSDTLQNGKCKMIVSSSTTNNKPPPFCSSDSVSSPLQRPTTLLNSQKCDGSSTTPSLASCSSSIPSPNRAVQRRNALADTEEHLIVSEAQQKRRIASKTSMAKLFDIQSSSSSSPSAAAIASSSSSIIYSEAAHSHKLQRTRQVAKCAQCEHLLLFDALKCQFCSLVWHRKCLPNVQIHCCQQNIKRFDNNEQKDFINLIRRTSIFGVPLNIHLGEQKRKIPLILEKCIDELQRRGMCCKGLYRTCGVKSKVEEICVQFEQSTINSPVDLSNVHPMNIASVVKLYLRRLPEPLLTYELYKEWLNIGIFSTNEEKEENKNYSSLQFINLLKQLIQKLPIPNLQTLRFLILHLNRITWFELQNLMTASNLAAVIAPSLLWQHLPLPNAIIGKGGGISSNNNYSSSSNCINSTNNNNNQQQQFISDAHRQSKTVELLIKYAFEIFDEDRRLDWCTFFSEYPLVTQPQQQRRHSLAATSGEIICDSSQQNNNNNKINNNNNVYQESNDEEDIIIDEEDNDDNEFIDYDDNDDEIELLINNKSKLQKIIFNGRRQSLETTINENLIKDNNNINNNFINEKQKLSRLKALGAVMGKSLPIEDNNNKQKQQLINNLNNNKYLFKSQPSTAPSQRRLNFQSHKQRSFTTSILVSPLSVRRNNNNEINNNNMAINFEIKNNSSSLFTNNNQRKLFSHKSLDENIILQKQQNNNEQLGRRLTLKSGEVTVQLGKDCLVNDGNNRLCVKLLSSCDKDVSYV